MVSEAAAAVIPVAGGAALTALPSAVQDLARFFLSLSGSSSLGAIRGMAGVTASAAGSGGAVCPLSVAGGAVTSGTMAVTPDGAGVSPAAPAAVPGVSGEQQRKVESRSRGRRSRSSSDGTDRRVKKRARRRSPSPGPSSRRRGRHHRSSSDSFEEDRADASPPRSGRAHGGAPGGASSSRAYDRSPRPGMSRSYAREDRYQSGGGRRSPAPSGVADDDRSSAFESVDFDRDDSFRSVLALIRSFHDMEEPAGVPSARCKTSLASAYGLMSEVSPAFTLPVSPLVRSLLDDTNLALSKFLEDQTVHGFLPVPGRRHRRYYRTSSSSFPGPYTVPPGVTSITLVKVSEAKKRSVALSASQVSSMEAMLSGVCEVSSWLEWWLSTCGGLLRCCLFFCLCCPFWGLLGSPSCCRLFCRFWILGDRQLRSLLWVLLLSLFLWLLLSLRLLLLCFLRLLFHLRRFLPLLSLWVLMVLSPWGLVGGVVTGVAAADTTHECHLPDSDQAEVYSDPLNFPEGEESDTRVRTEATGAFRQVLSFIASFFPDVLPSESQPPNLASRFQGFGEE